MINVMLQINDPSNGMPQHRIGGIVIDSFIELEPVVLPEPRFSVGEGWIRVHRRKFRFTTEHAWVGNWCWNAFTMPVPEAARLIVTCLQAVWTSKKPFKDGTHTLPIWGINQATGDAAIAIMDRHGRGEDVTRWMIETAIKTELGVSA